MKIEIISTDKHNFLVRCNNEEKLKVWVGENSRWASVTPAGEGVYMLRGMNKAQAADMARRIRLLDSPEKSAAQGRSSGGRRVALLKNAEGLNHGKAWVASAYDVDSKSLPPEWEGELICYIYE